MVNYAESKEQSIFYWALILSLLINCSALIYLLILQHFQTEKVAPVPHQATVHMHNESFEQAERWAQTYARQSIKDQPEYEEISQELNTKHENCNQEMTEEIFDTESKKLDQTALQSSSTEETVQNATVTDHKASTQNFSTDDYKANIQQKIQPRDHEPLESTEPIKKKITAADIAKGFLHNVRKQGTRAISMMGDPGAQMTQDQLRHERYLQKIYRTLDTAFRIYRHEMPHIGMQKLEVLVELALNKDGSIRWLKLSEGCGIHSVDLFILEVFKKASMSFAPVPDHLPHNPYIISLSLGIYPAKSTPIHLRH